MSIPTWLEMAKADAARRGLDPVLALLDGLGGAMEALRAAAEAPDAVSADHPIREYPTFTHAAESPAAHGGLPGLAQIAADLRAGRVTSERLVEGCLAKIAELQPALNAFVTITADDALAAAREADKRAAGGRPLGPLCGLPLSLKDLIDQAGVSTTASSLVRRDHRAAHDAPVTARLRAAGAVFVGKTNLHEFAFGTTSDDSGFGPARHPLDPSRSPGGSSGGSAISVATALASVGTDTGGSIRIPAAACGIVGLKPEWGEIPAAGVVPLSRQLDHVGPMTRSVADAWLLYDIMRGAAHEGVPPAASMRGVRVGVPRGYLFDRVHEDVEARVLEAVERLASAGAQVVDVEIPHITDTVPVYLALVLADAAEYHAATLESRPQDYTENVRFRLEMGRYVMGEDYVRALRLRDRLSRAVDHALEGVDVLAAPALAIPAPPIGAATVPVKGGSEVVRSAMLRNTQLFNLSRHPAISLPCGATREGLPVGLQLIGHRRGTARLLHDALAAESVLARV
jgi:aspartyl-tRNA(Asn)/glutamyl-tRNA(Gln) amidotransferase subunit A